MSSLDDEWRVRVANADESDDVAALASLRFHWRSVEGTEVGLDEMAYERAMGSWFSDHRDSHVAFLGYVGSAPVAMAWLALVDRVPGPEKFVRRCAYLQSVYVLPSHRSCGLGSKLVSGLIEYSFDLRLDYLAVHPSAQSFSFYGRLGFDPTSRVLELDLRPRYENT